MLRTTSEERAARNRHAAFARLLRRPEIEPRPCRICGRVFVPLRDRTQTCSTPCRKEAARLRYYETDRHKQAAARRAAKPRIEWEM